MKPVQLMIAGAPKCGTTSLKYYLGQHPEISTHTQLEMLYFTMDEAYQKGYQNAFSRYFKADKATQSVIMAKNVAIIYLPEAMLRLHEHNSDVQVVIALRHPVDRAYSAYWYARRNGWEDLLTFEEAIAAEPVRIRNNLVKLQGSVYLERSLYANHLAHLFQVFNKDHVHIYLLEDIIRDPINVCQSLFKMFDLDPTFIPDIKQRQNKASLPRYKTLHWLLSSGHPFPTYMRRLIRRLIPARYGDRIKIGLDGINEKDFKPPRMALETRTQLIDYFKPYNAELSSMLSRDLSFWDV